MSEDTHVTLALGFRVPRAAQANVNRRLLATVEALAGLGAELVIGARTSIMPDGSPAPVESVAVLTDRETEMIQRTLDGWRDRDNAAILREYSRQLSERPAH